MSDTTLCLNDKCPSKNHCKRYTTSTKQDGWQSYAMFEPDASGKCKEFEDVWSIKRKRKS